MFNVCDTKALVVLLPVLLVRHWHRLPQEAVNAPSLALLKNRLDRTLNNLV